MDSKARIVFRCEGCGASAPKKADVKHSDGEEQAKLKVVKTCEKSGTAPHVGKS